MEFRFSVCSDMELILELILNKIEKVYIGFTAFVVTMICVGRPWLGLLLSGPFIRAWITMVDNSEE